MCALCKSGIVRLFNQQLTCEVPNCVDLRLPIAHNTNQLPVFRVETTMNLLCQLVQDHQQNCLAKLGKFNLQFGSATETESKEI